MAETSAAAPAIPERPEQAKVDRILTVELGELTKPLRVLYMTESRKWKLDLVSVLAGQIGTIDVQTIADTGTVIDAASDRILEMVVRYDVDGSLGGREWIESHATDAQVYAVFRRCLEVSFPFVKDLRSALAEIRALGLADLFSSAKSPSESSTNGPSPDGDSTSTPVLLTSN